MNPLILYSSNEPYSLNDSYSSIDSNSYTSQKEEKKNSVKHLPKHVLHKVLSYLLETDLQTAVAVCKQWKAETISGVKHDKSSKLNCLSIFLKNNFSNSLYSSNNETLNEIGKTMHSANNLKQIKKAEEALKQKVADALNHLSEEDIRSIYDHRQVKESTTPRKRARRNTNDLSPSVKPTKLKAVALKEIVLDLSKLGLVDFAHVVSETIEMDTQKSDALLSVSKVLVEEGRDAEALETAYEIKPSIKRANALLYISESKVKHRHLEEASAIAEKIPVHAQKAKAESLIFAARKE